jgi:ABC-type Fe3+ transport system permease subunit
LIAAMAITMVFAAQEFAVYEPTGVRVVATEVRMVFATGAFGSGPIAGADQEQRAADAILTAAPLLVVTVLLALLAVKIAGKFSIGAVVHANDWPPILDAPKWIIALAGALLLLTLGVPIGALLASLKYLDSPAVLLNEFGGALAGSGFLFLIVGILAIVLAFSASAFWTPGLLAASGLSFLMGGEILAIALIRIFNRPAFQWVYDAWPLPVIAYLGRFACIALFTARCTWSPVWRNLRIQAAHDGAKGMTIARRIIWPLAWPIFAAGALLAGILSFGEVDATATLIPQHPSVLTTLLLTMANASRSNRLVEGSLLAVGLVFASLVLFLVVQRAMNLWPRTFDPTDSRRR